VDPAEDDPTHLAGRQPPASTMEKCTMTFAGSRPRILLPAVGAAVLLALTACSGSGAGTTGGDAKRDITIAIPGTPGAPLDVEPCDSENGGPLILRYNVIQSLTDLDPQSRNVVPLLATKWKQTNPTTWTFTLREGVTFHDGQKFDAAAAVFGINRSLNNKSIACSDTAKVGAGIKVTPRAISPTELQITTSVPDPILDRELSYIDLVSPKTPADKVTDQPIGTGPYTWGKNVPGQYFEVNRWDGYWGDKPQVTSAKVILRQEDTVRANVVKTGEADIATNIATHDATNDDQTKQVPLDAVFGYRLPVQRAPFTDVRVRQAVEYAINKEQIAKSLLGLTGTPGDQLVAASNNGYVPGYKAPTYDLVKAKSLLAEAKAAGVAVDTPVNLVGMTNQFPGSDEVEQAVQQDLEKAGFKVSLQNVDPAEWKKLLFKPFPPNQTPTILGFKHDNTSGDASSSYTSYMASAGCCASLSDKAFDQAFGKGLAASGPERARRFQEAAKLEYSRGVSIVAVANLSGLMLVSQRINFTPDALSSKFRLPLANITFK
jgi:peptide/nickel transport system substrate-binding protein